MPITEETTAEKPRIEEHYSTGSALADMVRELKDDIASMFRLKAELVKCEVRESVQGYAKDGIFMAVAAGLFLFATIFLNVTLTFLLARLFPFSLPINMALGALIVTLLNAIGGGVLFLTAKKRMANRSLVPKRTLHEIERDKQWLSNEVM